MSNTVENDLQALANTTDRALYIRIKVRHPYWSDELVRKEIERLRSGEFAKDMQELYRKVNERKRR